MQYIGASEDGRFAGWCHGQQSAMMLAADPYERSLCLLEFGSTAFGENQFDPGTGRFHMLELHSAQTQLLHIVTYLHSNT